MNMRDIAIVLIIAAATTAAWSQSEIYLSARADGKDGSGTAADPFNGSTQAKFDAVFAGIKPNSAVHIGAGVFHTKGWASFMLPADTKVRGAGMEVTKLILDGTGKPRASVFVGDDGGYEIEDLSIDCGYENQRKVNGVNKCNASAINLRGSHLAVRRCRVSSYGSPYDDECGENFAVSMCQGPQERDGEDMVVEDCVFTGMSPLSPSSSVLTISGGALKGDVQLPNWTRGAVARRNHFMGYHPGCHGITMSGCQGCIVEDNYFEHFMGDCVYTDTWPLRNHIYQNNIFTDVNQAIWLAGDNWDLANLHIRGNIILLHDGFDIKSIDKGVVTTDIPHSFMVGNEIAFRDMKIIGGSVKNEQRVFVTSVPSRTTFTYSSTKDGKSDAADTATGGFIRAIHYGYTPPNPEGIVLFGGSGQELHVLKNIVISGNVIRPYSSGGKNRIPSTGICLRGAENSQIFNNVVFDGGNHCGLIVASTLKVKSTVLCRDNYNIDNTPALPRDDKGNLVADAIAPPAITTALAEPEVGGVRLSHPVDAAGPSRDHHFAGKPGDYATSGDFLFIYTGDGTKHLWKRIAMGDY
jgi:hypothetical protein